MKKRIFLLLALLFLATGCTCQYNLTIDNNVYKEDISIIGENNNEITELNKKWQIPVDKDEYNVGTDPSTSSIPVTDTYKYSFSGSKLSLKNDFTKNAYMNSTAVSNCYNKLTIDNYSESIIISTTRNAICFEKYPSLNSVVVNITVDKPVTSNNADSVNGKTYTWIINKNNASKKSINLVLDNSDGNDSVVNDNQAINNSNKKNDYTMYIFAGVLLVVMLLAYVIVNTIKNKDDNLDD